MTGGIRDSFGSFNIYFRVTCRSKPRIQEDSGQVVVDTKSTRTRPYPRHVHSVTNPKKLYYRVRYTFLDKVMNTIYVPNLVLSRHLKFKSW